jgi:hypothetical protein
MIIKAECEVEVQFLILGRFSVRFNADRSRIVDFIAFDELVSAGQKNVTLAIIRPAKNCLHCVGKVIGLRERTFLDYIDRSQRFSSCTMNLVQLWKLIKDDLERAYATLPSEAISAPSLVEYREYLRHNELELACDMLETFAESNQVSSEFWLALSTAAEKMNLHDKSERFRQLSIK